MPNPRGKSAYEKWVATFSVDILSRPNQRQNIAEPPTISTGSIKKPKDVRTGWSPVSKTVALAESSPDLATPEPGPPFPRHWRTRRKLKPRECRQVRPAAESSNTGASGIVPQFFYRARRQECRCCRGGRRGYNRGKTCNPCCPTSAAETSSARIRECAPPRMQSLVRHDVHTPGREPTFPNGETSDCTKLNWPIGQTYLQNAAPRKKPSIANAAAK